MRGAKILIAHKTNVFMLMLRHNLDIEQKKWNTKSVVFYCKSVFYNGDGTSAFERTSSITLASWCLACSDGVE